jgi:1,4-alpha-glucan branching enzyme
VHRRWHHRDLTFGLLYAFSETFVLPLSHDEVVHGKASLVSKMPGDEWQRFANLRSLLAWQWALPGAPLLFMGGELGRWDEWREDESLPLHLLDHAHHRGVRDLVATMNHVSREWPALWERDQEAGGFQWLDADDALHSTYSFVRWGRDGGQVVVCVANLTPVPRRGFRVGVPWSGRWEVLLDTDASVFWGSGLRGDDGGHVAADGDPWQGQPASVVIDLPPLAVLWLGAPRQ